MFEILTSGIVILWLLFFTQIPLIAIRIVFAAIGIIGVVVTVSGRNKVMIEKEGISPSSPNVVGTFIPAIATTLESTVFAFRPAKKLSHQTPRRKYSLKLHF